MPALYKQVIIVKLRSRRPSLIPWPWQHLRPFGLAFNLLAVYLTSESYKNPKVHEEKQDTERTTDTCTLAPSLPSHRFWSFYSEFFLLISEAKLPFQSGSLLCGHSLSDSLFLSLIIFTMVTKLCEALSLIGCCVTGHSEVDSPSGLVLS